MTTIYIYIYIKVYYCIDISFVQVFDEFIFRMLHAKHGLICKYPDL